LNLVQAFDAIHTKTQSNSRLGTLCQVEQVKDLCMDLYFEPVRAKPIIKLAYSPSWLSCFQLVRVVNSINSKRL